MGTDIEALAIGDCFLVKETQDAALAEKYHGQFALD